MMKKTSEEMRDDNIKLSSSYALIGVVVVVAFVAGAALLVLYSNTSLLPSSFDYRVFAQHEDNKTTRADDTSSLTNLSSNSTLIDFV
ncbi:MAG: hypothetical protein ICV56_02450, partial [Nitrososphaeraceae archaeon]|nr:hypothetical protein [Nitrososphaeraceae archaeon]